MRHTMSVGARAALLGCLYALGALLPYWYLDSPSGGAVFFPSAGLALATLLLTRPKSWPLWLGAFAVAGIVVDLTHDQSVAMALGFAVANTVEPALGAWLMRVTAGGRLNSRRRNLALYVGCAVIAAPMVGGIIGGLVSALGGTEDFLPTASKWWLGDALGVLVIATAITGWVHRKVYEVRATPLDHIGFAALAAAVTIVPTIVWDETFVYAVLPVMIWAALRGGPEAVAITGVAVAFSANWVFATGHAQDFLSASSQTEVLIGVQLFVAITVLVALVFALEVCERTKVERRARKIEVARARAEFAALRAADDERRRIARETHDIVGHALNVMLLSAGGARRLLTDDPAAARELLETLEDVGREAFGDLDVALGLVDRSPDVRTEHGVADLDELVTRLQRAGMDVSMNVGGTPRPLPRLVDWSVYRIIQESLTNVAKHSADANAIIDLCFADGALVVTVADDGAQIHPTSRNGQGLVGMRERVEVLGGHLYTGPQSGGGFAIRAEIPIGR